MAEQNAATWIDPTGHKWILPPFTTKLSPWKRIKHKAITDFVYSRACHKCEHCGSPSDLNVDHIIPRRAGGTHHPDNLQILCSHCHGKKTGLEAHQWPFSQFPTFKEQRRYNGGMF